MYCPFCNAEETKVVDSRLVTENKIRRRRECPACDSRFTTYESAELSFPWIIKRDGQRESFNDTKLRAGMLRALEKRPVSVEAVDTSIDHVMQRLRESAEREVTTETLGEWVMDELRGLDQVAYVRFASVYRCFQDISAFGEEIKRLQAEQAPENVSDE